MPVQGMDGAADVVQLRAEIPAQVGLRAEPRVEAPPRIAPVVRGSISLVVVLGMSETGLGAMRLLGQSGVRCWGVDSGEDRLGFSSRYCERHFQVKRDVTPGELRAVLRDIASEIPGTATLLPTSDRFVQLVSGIRSHLRGSFHVALPAPPVVDDLLDKQRFAERAARAGLRVPRTVPVADLRRLCDAVLDVGFPAIVKPRASQPDRAFPKAVVLRCAADVRDLVVRHAESAAPPLVVQEYVPGGDARNVSVAVALDGASRPVATFVSRKRRQGNRGAGVGTFVERCEDEEAAEMARRFLRRIGYVGAAEMELKRDARTNKLFAIEVNPRLWSQVTLPAAVGLNFPLLVHRIATGAPVEVQSPSSPAKVAWQDLLGDTYWTFCKGGYWRRGEVSALGWLRQALTSRGHPFFAWSDPLPAVKRLWREFLHDNGHA